MFWEASVFASSVISFTTNGFFEKEGYVEPKISSVSNKAAAISIPIAVGVLAILVGVAVMRR
jgi:H+/Cl- antiporter ClcA